MAGFKGITVNTPTESSPHIYAEDDAAIYESLVGDDAVFDIGKKMAATILNNNKVRISDGVICVGGHFGRIPYGEYVDCTIENGISGKKRNDLIVCRLETTGTGGTDTFSIAVKKGVAGTAASDPGITQNNIYNAGRIREFPLYRVKIDGINITAAEALFEPTPTLKETQRRIKTTEEQGYKNILDTPEEHRYQIGKEMHVVGTITKQSAGDYISLFTLAKLKELFGADFDMTRFSITTYNGDASAARVHLYAPEFWNDGAIYQYYYPAQNGPIRVNYHMIYKMR